MRRFVAAFIAVVMTAAIAVPIVASASSPSSSDMLKEQVASQKAINSLMGTAGSSSTWVKTITFGKVTKTSTKAVVAVTCTASAGSVKGTLVLKKYSGKWYFYSITAGGAGGVSNVKIPAGISTSAIAGAISAQRNHQYLIGGIVSGGYKKLTVTSRHTFSNAKQVNIKLSGGSRSATYGRVLAYRKTASNGTKYWFVSAIK